MKEISIKQLVELIKSNIENTIYGDIRIYEDKGNVCAELSETYILTQLPKEGKYDYIFEKLKDSFEYELVSQHDFGGFYEGLMFVESECIEFDYQSKAGQDWLYENF